MLLFGRLEGIGMVFIFSSSNLWQSQGNNCEVENKWEDGATSYDRADFQVTLGLVSGVGGFR